MTTFRVDLPQPLDLAESLAPFRRSGDDLIDRWDGVRLLRTSLVNGRVVAWRAERAPTPGQTDDLRAALFITPDRQPAPDDASALASAIRATFVEAPPSWPDLVARDPVLADLDRRFAGLRPVLQPDLLTALIRSISAQQVNLTWAATTRRRLAEAFGDQHFVGGETVYRLSAPALAAASPDEIRALQFTNAKARSIVDVATAIARGDVDPEALASAPDEEVIERLVVLHGIGVWSAEWILARTFGRPRVVAGDLGVRKAVARAYLGQDIAPEAEVRRATAHWRENAGIAQALLLRTLVP